MNIELRNKGKIRFFFSCAKLLKRKNHNKYINIHDWYKSHQISYVIIDLNYFIFSNSKLISCAFLVKYKCV